MPDIVYTDLIAEKNRPDQKAWFWLLELTVSDTVTLYATDYTEEVTFDGVLFKPVRFSVTGLQATGDGSISDSHINLDNIRRELGKELINARGLTGRSIILREVNLRHIGNPSAVASTYVLKISGLDGGANDADFTLGRADLRRSNYPKRRMFPTCGFVFGGTRCGYDITNGAMKICTHFLRGPNGCESHGAEEQGRGLTPAHPLQFGGFPTSTRQQ